MEGKPKTFYVLEDHPAHERQRWYCHFDGHEAPMFDEASDAVTYGLSLGAQGAIIRTLEGAFYLLGEVPDDDSYEDTELLPWPPSEIQRQQMDRNYALATELSVEASTEYEAQLASWEKRRLDGTLRPGEEHDPLERVPQWHRIARDLEVTAGLLLEVRTYPSLDMDRAITYEIRLGSSHHGSFTQYFDESDPELLLVQFTDVLCDQFLWEEIWGGWPICPVHKTHPLDACLDDSDHAAWVCPKKSASIHIGELTTDFLNS